MNAGAYGYTMASMYNSRFRPAQVMVKDGKCHLISRADTLEDILSTQIDLEE
jgi:diaminopimelate decarboxylase